MMKDWIKAAGIRAVRTVAQTAVALIGTGMIGMLDVDWVRLISVASLAGIVSLLTSVAGLPELRQEPGEITSEEAERLLDADRIEGQAIKETFTREDYEDAEG